MPTIGQLTILFAVLGRRFLRDDDAFLLAVFVGGMTLISINRSKRLHKVEHVREMSERTFAAPWSGGRLNKETRMFQ